MPPTDNYEVMFYLSIDATKAASGYGPEDWVEHVEHMIDDIPGVRYGLGYIDSADYAVGE